MLMYDQYPEHMDLDELLRIFALSMLRRAYWDVVDKGPMGNEQAFEYEKEFYKTQIRALKSALNSKGQPYVRLEPIPSYISDNWEGRELM